MGNDILKFPSKEIVADLEEIRGDRAVGLPGEQNLRGDHCAVLDAIPPTPSDAIGRRIPTYCSSEGVESYTRRLTVSEAISAAVNSPITTQKYHWRMAPSVERRVLIVRILRV